MMLDLINSAARPSELTAILKVKLAGQPLKYNKPLNELASRLSDKEFCYAALNKVSRSFAVVIRQLPDDLKDAVCVFYLVLRGLDSVEDDMNIPAEQKAEMLLKFHKLCQQPGFKLDNVGDTEDYRQLMQHFDKVVNTYLSLNTGYRQVIDNICMQMGAGMQEFMTKKVNSTADYDQYCHYVAGLVGIGLSGLFSASKHESAYLETQKVIANSMGLMLQKTNITRDYFEDIPLGREFWPSEIWGNYANHLHELKDIPESAQSLAAVNHMVSDALQHVPDCIAYMKMLQNPQIFRFCAIPQVMAMATLAKVYNNPQVFTENVKVRKGLAARMMVETVDMESMNYFLEKFTHKLMGKLSIGDPNYLITKKRLHRIIEAIDETRVNHTIVPQQVSNIEESVLF